MGYARLVLRAYRDFKVAVFFDAIRERYGSNGE